MAMQSEQKPGVRCTVALFYSPSVRCRTDKHTFQYISCNFNILYVSNISVASFFQFSFHFRFQGTYFFLSCLFFSFVLHTFL